MTRFGLSLHQTQGSSPPSSGRIHPIGSQDWQSILSTAVDILALSQEARRVTAEVCKLAPASLGDN